MKATRNAQIRGLKRTFDCPWIIGFGCDIGFGSDITGGCCVSDWRFCRFNGFVCRLGVGLKLSEKTTSDKFVNLARIKPLRSCSTSPPPFRVGAGSIPRLKESEVMADSMISMDLPLPSRESKKVNGEEREIHLMSTKAHPSNSLWRINSAAWLEPEEMVVVHSPDRDWPSRVVFASCD